MTDLKLSNYIKYRWQKSLIKVLNAIMKPNYGLFRKDISEIRGHRKFEYQKMARANIMLMVTKRKS